MLLIFISHLPNTVHVTIIIFSLIEPLSLTGSPCSCVGVIAGQRWIQGVNLA